MFLGHLILAHCAIKIFQKQINNKHAMKNNFSEDYQYNSCVSRGICSINPRTSSLQEILVLYLKQTAYYMLKLQDKNYKNEEIKNLILNTLSAMVSNTSFSEIDFEMITNHFNKLLPEIIQKYEDICEKDGIKPEHLKTILKYNAKSNIVKSIRMGEKEFLKTINSIPQKLYSMYRLMFIIAKSICTNVQDLETLEEDSEIGYITILEILNYLNSESLEAEELKNILNKITKVNHDLMKNLREIQIKKYGKQQIADVSYTTIPGKAVLVVGSNIRELEIILEALENKNIDVYTHDEMILAHTFPFFKKYKNLKGQFGKGIESCHLDFATFPGPIIITRHSLYNIENLYRGRLFSTDPTNTRGVIPIRENSFEEVIKSANDSKGFKSGKTCQNESVGLDYEKMSEKIKTLLQSDKYSQIFIIGTCGYSQEQQNYTKKLIEKAPENILIISLSYYIDKTNVICSNAYFDTYAVSYIAEYISKICSKKITIFFPVCDRHTISKMIYFSSENIAKIFVGSCSPIIVNPNLISILKEVYDIETFSTVKSDLNKILNKN